jgi:hypothetical protein
MPDFVKPPPYRMVADPNLRADAGDWLVHHNYPGSDFIQNDKALEKLQESLLLIAQFAANYASAGMLAEMAALRFAAAAAARAAEGAGTEAAATEEACSGGICNVCFPADTVVAAENGERPIQDIAVGDLVWSRDPVTGDVVLQPVVRRFVTEEQPLVEAEFLRPDGASEALRATPNHPFWTEDRGWIRAADLRPGELVQMRDGEKAAVGSEHAESGTTTVYNIEVAHAHTYFVGHSNIWVHNACDPNKLNHIFNKAAHNLGGLVKQFGGQQAAFDAVETAITKQVLGNGTTGVFEQAVNVAGNQVTVRGIVQNGIVRIGTFWM